MIRPGYKISTSNKMTSGHTLLELLIVLDLMAALSFPAYSLWSIRQIINKSQKRRTVQMVVDILESQVSMATASGETSLISLQHDRIGTTDSQRTSWHKLPANVSLSSPENSYYCYPSASCNPFSATLTFKDTTSTCKVIFSLRGRARSVCS